MADAPHDVPGDQGPSNLESEGAAPPARKSRRWLIVAAIVVVVVGGAAGGYLVLTSGPEGIPSEVRKKALANFEDTAGPVSEVYAEGSMDASELEKLEPAVAGIAGGGKDRPLYAMLVKGHFELEYTSVTQPEPVTGLPIPGEPNLPPIVTGPEITTSVSEYKTARIVFDDSGEILIAYYWDEEVPPPPVFGDHFPKADAVSLGGLSLV